MITLMVTMRLPNKLHSTISVHRNTATIANDIFRNNSWPNISVTMNCEYLLAWMKIFPPKSESSIICCALLIRETVTLEGYALRLKNVMQQL